MIRTLVLVAVVSFVLAVGCIAGAFAIVGGPFNIDDGLRFHRVEWRDLEEDRQPVSDVRPARPPLVSLDLS